MEEHKPADPSRDGTRRLRTEIPGAPPCTLPTNQSEEGHTPCSPPLPPILPLKTLPGKPVGSFRAFEHEQPALLAWPLQQALLCSKLLYVLLCLALPCVRHMNLSWTTGLGYQHGTWLCSHTVPFFLLPSLLLCARCHAKCQGAGSKVQHLFSGSLVQQGRHAQPLTVRRHFISVMTVEITKVIMVFAAHSQQAGPSPGSSYFTLSAFLRRGCGYNHPSTQEEAEAQSPKAESQESYGARLMGGHESNGWV